MKKNNLFSVGQAVGIYHLTSLPLSKISLLEKTVVFNERRFVVGRILGFEESTSFKTVPDNNLLIITINGFIISSKKDDIFIDPDDSIDSFLKREEFLTLSMEKEPYNGRLVKKDDGNWYIQV